LSGRAGDNRVYTGRSVSASVASWRVSESCPFQALEISLIISLSVRRTVLQDREKAYKHKSTPITCGHVLSRPQIRVCRRTCLDVRISQLHDCDGVDRQGRFGRRGRGTRGLEKGRWACRQRVRGRNLGKPVSRQKRRRHHHPGRGRVPTTPRCARSGLLR
jgi:hypothetical protein